MKNGQTLINIYFCNCSINEYWEIKYTVKDNKFC